jgi:hypothetical protein
LPGRSSVPSSSRSTLKLTGRASEAGRWCDHAISAINDTSAMTTGSA